MIVIADQLLLLDLFFFRKRERDTHTHTQDNCLCLTVFSIFFTHLELRGSAIIAINFISSSALRDNNETDEILFSIVMLFLNKTNFRVEQSLWQITILGKRKGDLEKRLSILTDERSQLTMSLEESSDRILLLEKKNQELEHAIRSQYKELEELRHANCQLQNKMDRTAAAVNSRSVIASTASDAANSPSNQPTSLYNEIEMSSSSSIEEELCKTFSGHHDSDEDIECDLTPSVYPLMDDSWKVNHHFLFLFSPFLVLCSLFYMPWIINWPGFPFCLHSLGRRSWAFISHYEPFCEICIEGEKLLQAAWTQRQTREFLRLLKKSKLIISGWGSCLPLFGRYKPFWRKYFRKMMRCVSHLHNDDHDNLSKCTCFNNCHQLCLFCSG